MSGDVPDGWSLGPVLDFFQLQRGHDLPVQDRQPGTVPVIASNGRVGWHDQSPLTGPGVVTGRSGTIGNVRYIKEAYWPLNTTLYVRDFKGSDPEFTYYFLQHFPLKDYATGTGVPTLNRNDVHAVEVVFPPLDEQRRIAEVLLSVDEAIAAADAVVMQAVEAFEALLADLSARYGEASAKLESYCVVGGLQTGPFGSQLKAMDYVEEGVPVIMPVDLTSSGMDFAGAKKAAAAKSRELARHILQPGDVLFARRGEIGRCGLYLSGDPVALCGTGCLRARLNTAKIDPALAYFLIQSRQAREWLCAHAVGATMPNLNTTIIGDLPMPNIPKDEQSKWVDALLMIEGSRRINQRTLAALYETKTVLISDLLSGRVRVSL